MKVQTGLWVDKLVLDRFKALCEAEKLGLGESVEELMEMCLDAESVTAILTMQTRKTGVQLRADELKLKGALASLQSFINSVEKKIYYVSVNDKDTRIDQAIYKPAYETAVAILPEIQNPELIKEAEQVMEKANQSLEKM